MTQATRVLTVDATGAAALEGRLRAELPPDAEWRRVPHARFSVKAIGVVATCYLSGKVVVQGPHADAFVDRFLADAGATGTPVTGPGVPRFDTATIGSDEAGKGDYFGPLVVAAVFATPDQAPLLREIRVADSKGLGDERAMRLAGLLERQFDHEIVTLEPSAYNARWARVRNVNVVLAEQHARAISALLGRHPETETVVVDRFADEALVARALARHGAHPAQLVQVPRAESHAVVAAASILARAAFLDGLRACSDTAGSDLHKGAGPPVDACARRVFAIGGRELLERVAKVHFKNTERIPQR